MELSYLILMKGPALLQAQKMDYIRKWISEKNLKKSGRKQELVDRLVPHLTDSDWRKIESEVEPRYTIHAKIKKNMEKRFNSLREIFLETVKRMKIVMDKNPDKAVKILSEFMNTQIPLAIRGKGLSMGFNDIEPQLESKWIGSNYDLAWAMSILNHTEEIKQEVMDFVLDIRKYFSNDKVRALAFTATNKIFNQLELQRFKKENWNRIQVSVASTACGPCKKLDRTYPIDNAPELPNPQCTHEEYMYCRCIYLGSDK